MIFRNYHRFLALVLFRGALDIAYAVSVVPNYENLGMGLSVDPLKLIESYLLMFVLFKLLPTEVDRFARLAVQFLFIFGYIPVLSFYGLSDASREWTYLSSLFWLIVILIARAKWKFRIPALAQSQLPSVSLVALLIVGTITMLSMRAPLSISLDLTTVYDTREIFYENAEIGIYLVSWVAKVAVPFMLLLALISRPSLRYPLVLASVVVGLIVFSNTGEKNYLFRIPFVFILAWLLNRRHFFLRSAAIFSAVALSGVISYLLINDYWLVSLFTRRIWFGPAQLSFYYFDFFDGRPIYLAASRLGAFAPSYQFSLPPPQLIGLHYFGAAEVSANNGVAADGFMNFGIAGVVIWGLVLGILLRVAEALVEGKNRILAQGLLLGAFVTLIDGYLLTTIVTHGLLFAFLLVFLLPKEKRQVALSAFAPKSLSDEVILSSETPIEPQPRYGKPPIPVSRRITGDERAQE